MGLRVGQIQVQLGGGAAEGVVGREEGELIPIARDSDGILMVEPPHPSHLRKCAALGVQDHGVTGLALRSQGGVRTVGGACDHVDDVVGLLPGEECVT